jgi:4a-hydroxytetrahydrobiopterin dehydratase
MGTTTMAAKLDDTARDKALKEAPGWSLSKDGKGIEKTFKFKDFIEAFGFMTSSALVAQSMDHHPDWSNAYNKVEVTLSTHDAGGLTKNDFELAKAMDRFASHAS